MAIEAIRNLINQTDKSLFDVKNKLKEEKDKNLLKVQEQLPTPEDITSQIKSNVCNLETSNAIDKNFNQLKNKVDGIRGKIEGGIKKLQALEGKLTKIRDKIFEAIRKILEILGAIILICNIIIKVLPKALNFLSGLAANGGIQKRLSDLIDKAKSKIETFKATVKSVTVWINENKKEITIILSLIAAAIAALQSVIDFINKIISMLEQLYLFYLAQCNLPADPPINADGSLNLGLIIDGLTQENNNEIIEKIYNANFETIGYRRYKL